MENAKWTMENKNMKKSINWFYHLGNVLITISLFGFLYIFYPLAQIYFFPITPPSLSSMQGTYLSVPKIKAYAPVVEQVDPFDEPVYQKALKSGVAHAQGSSLPGQNGTVYIFAHSSGSPWEITRLNTIFLRLGELQKGDKIEIQKDKKVYRYKVREKKEVMPSEISYLINTTQNQLILQTCTPIGTDWRRLLVFADPI